MTINEEISDIYSPRFPIHNIGMMCVRGILFCLMTAAHYFLYMNYKLSILSDAVIFLSSWGFWTTHAYLLLVLIMFPDREVSKRFGHFFHTVIVLEIVINVIFWALINGGTSEHQEGIDWQNLALHLLPVSSMLMDFIINRIYVCKESLKFLLAVFLAYSAVNMTYVFKTGEAIYPGLTWNDWGSVVFIGASLVMLLGGWYLIILVQKVKYVTKNSLTEGLKS